jgi:hemolysin III
MRGALSRFDTAPIMAAAASLADPGTPRRAQSDAEEFANTLSHAFGCVVALAAWPLLADAAQRQSGVRGMLAVGLFCMTMALQYAASTACHGLPPGRARQWARSIDHAAIFLFIAGSASPFTLGAMADAAGTLTFALVWTLALWGAALKLRRRLTNRRLSTGLYVLFGWLAVLAAWQGARMLDGGAVGWLVAGGLAYLVGAAFFVFDATLRFGHFLWHLCVLAGSACHVAAAIGPGAHGFA